MPGIFGIDLGTTNSLIAQVADGEPRVIADPSTGARLLPSVVHFVPDGTLLVGQSAREAEVAGDGVTIASAKRLMGIGMEHVNDDDRRQFPLVDATEGPVRLELNGREVTPPQVSAEVLKELKRRAEAATGGKVADVVITVPAYFNDSQRQATRDAGRLAGLRVLRLVNEPTAASLAYGLDRRDRGVVAVYDLGGGTFDISILRLEDGVFQVLATNGDTRLGGDDFDRRFARLILERAAEEHGSPGLLEDAHAWALARREAEAAKVRLSSAEETAVRLDLPEEGTFELLVTRNDFEDLIRDIAEKTLGPCRQAMKDAGLKPEDVDEVVLVGGSTRVPLVQRIVKEFFAAEPLCSIDPDEVVALGAAVQADILGGGTKDLLLLDVVPLSLGIETMGGVMTRLIHRNTTIPYSVTEEFTTPADNVTHIDVHVLQGERELARDARSLARFKLPVEPAPAGMAHVLVNFLIDANGILSVTAMDAKTGREHTVEVKPSYGLTDEQVEEMLLASFDHAEEDVTNRLLAETRVEADSILLHTKKVVAEAGDDVQAEEKEQIEVAARDLREKRESDDRDAILDAMTRLDEATRPLAERVMTRSIQQLIVNRTVEEVAS